ncbi:MULTISPECIES: lytic transglycosylase domain-containing protein [unclassified Streptomyces]|uniref:lytic transglycosylase domain-containing protein n=1 Tax=unclassified Streptomyces TaxID=2593676 RepID=UPI0031FCBDE8
MAAAAMAALSASQGPGFFPVAHAHALSQDQQQVADSAPAGPEIDGGSPYITEVPPLNTPTGPLAPLTPTGDPDDGGLVTVPDGGASLPTTVLAAYMRAEADLAESDPGCHLPWQLLAAIGQVESGQARGGAVDANGTTYSPILGPVLNGDGFANISDTDGGAYDGDPLHDRAVGPMQFIPSTWETWGADGNGDGVRDPNNVYDAALAAGRYLCADGRDLAVPHNMDRAILGYNHSQAYLELVRSWYEHFLAGGAVSVPDRSGASGPGVVPPPPNTSRPGHTSTPQPTASGSASPTVPPGGSSSPTPTLSPTAPPPTSPTGTPTTSPSSSPTGGSPSGDPTTGTPTPSDPTTTPGCPTDPASPSPTDSVSPSPTGTPTGTPTPDPCATDTPTGTPTPSSTGGATKAAF